MQHSCLLSCFAILSIAVTVEATAQESAAEIAIGGQYKSETQLSDNGQTIIAENITALSLSVSDEKELLRRNDMSLVLEGEASMLYGRANNVVIDNTNLSGSATYRALKGFSYLSVNQDAGDIQLFAKTGIGLIYEDLETKSYLEDTQKFHDLSPAARFRIGARKNVSENASFGISVGKTTKLD